MEKKKKKKIKSTLNQIIEGWKVYGFRFRKKKMREKMKIQREKLHTSDLRGV